MKKITAWICLLALACVLALPCFAADTTVSASSKAGSLGVCTACSDTACDIALELPVGVRLRSAAQKLSAIDEAHFVTSAVCPNCGVQTEDVQWSYTGSDGYTQILCSHRNYGLDTIFTYQDFYTATCHNCAAMQNRESVRAGLTEADYIFTVTHTRNVTMCQGRSHI